MLHLHGCNKPAPHHRPRDHLIPASGTMPPANPASARIVPAQQVSSSLTTKSSPDQTASPAPLVPLTKTPGQGHHPARANEGRNPTLLHCGGYCPGEDVADGRNEGRNPTLLHCGPASEGLDIIGRRTRVGTRPSFIAGVPSEFRFRGYRQRGSEPDPPSLRAGTLAGDAARGR